MKGVVEEAMDQLQEDSSVDEEEEEDEDVYDQVEYENEREFDTPFNTLSQYTGMHVNM